MKILKAFWISFFTALAMLGCNQSKPEITVSDVWSRPVELIESTNGAANAKPDCCAADEATTENSECGLNNVNGVVYLRIKNSGGTPDRLLSVKSSAAKVVEIHVSKMEEGRMSMQKVQSGIELPASETIELKPGGYHIMLIGLKRALKIDEEFFVELEFEKSPRMTVTSSVRLF